MIIYYHILSESKTSNNLGTSSTFLKNVLEVEGLRCGLLSHGVDQSTRWKLDSERSTYIITFGRVCIKNAESLPFFSGSLQEEVSVHSLSGLQCDPAWEPGEAVAHAAGRKWLHPAASQQKNKICSV